LGTRPRPSARAERQRVSTASSGASEASRGCEKEQGTDQDQPGSDGSWRRRVGTPLAHVGGELGPRSRSVSEARPVSQRRRRGRPDRPPGMRSSSQVEQDASVHGRPGERTPAGRGPGRHRGSDEPGGHAARTARWVSESVSSAASLPPAASPSLLSEGMGRITSQYAKGPPGSTTRGPAAIGAAGPSSD